MANRTNASKLGSKAPQLGEYGDGFGSLLMAGEILAGRGTRHEVTSGGDADMAKQPLTLNTSSGNEAKTAEIDKSKQVMQQREEAPKNGVSAEDLKLSRKRPSPENESAHSVKKLKSDVSQTESGPIIPEPSMDPHERVKLEPEQGPDSDLEDRVRGAWMLLARRDIHRGYKYFLLGRKVMLRNAAVAALACSKEVRRRGVESRRFSKDVPIRGRKIMREMLTYWRRQENMDREHMKRVMKENRADRKKEVEQQEVERQSRKFKYLITQAELYAHFMQSKLKGKEDQEKKKEILSNLDDCGQERESSVLKSKALGNAKKAVTQQEQQLKKLRPTDSKMSIKNVSEGLSLTTPALAEEGIAQPSMFQGSLKSYQINGISWLAALFNNGINGILADEMGLGKTVQSIATLAHLAETHGLWGPFLIIAPSSTLHNWEQEFRRFTPSFKVLPYWGSQAQRKILRKDWNSPNMHALESPFHVVITSYQLAVSDEKYFQRVPWQYMVLDEAQALKSSNSMRWNTLLGFKCGQRLLLTGTPIQNSMAELWALLHFVMPSLFDSHAEFNEWFSKDIENKASNKTASLNPEQLNRLHLILKPFMLRRLKRDVENELPDKIEVNLNCQLSRRQKALYDTIKQKISIEVLMGATMSSSDKQAHGELMNFVMQFRKVCNHPDLFMRRGALSPFYFESPRWGFMEGPGQKLDLVSYCSTNAIMYTLPRLIFREIVLSRINHGGIDHIPWLCRRFGVTNADHMHRVIFPFERDDGGTQQVSGSIYSTLRLMNISPGLAAEYFESSFLDRILLQSLAQLHSLSVSPFAEKRSSRPCLLLPSNSAALLVQSRVPRLVQRLVVQPAQAPSIVPYVPGCIAASNVFETNPLFTKDDIALNAMISNVLPMKLQSNPSFAAQYSREKHGKILHQLPGPDAQPNIVHPPRTSLLTDCDKMQKLDALLTKLFSEGHRVLIYSQMTRMLDLLEEYMAFRRYEYVRLDGSSKIHDRRDMVADFQNRSDIFIFLLSTRAGGLGINLTAADTVIFYDSDWNPTVDQQAMDRAHRLGQTKQVTVYRLITEGTIEERILQRARQKSEIQRMVITGDTLGTDESKVDLNAGEVVSLLLDDEELQKMKKRQQEHVQELEREREKRRIKAKERTKAKRLEKKSVAAMEGQPGAKKKKVEKSKGTKSKKENGEGTKT
eukprot:m.52961 g.52961  ORF g.52961 m.52961 type:complete len:1185 (+) comp10830_c0_seq1:304-3858(+)